MDYIAYLLLFNLKFNDHEKKSGLTIVEQAIIMVAGFEKVVKKLEQQVTLHSFGYSHYGLETGAVRVLHSWGQNICLHPHIHCIVPAAGYSLRGEWKNMDTNNNFLYPVYELSKTFKGKFLDSLKRKRNLDLQFFPNDKADLEHDNEKAREETPQQRLKRLTGFDVYQCPFCKKGRMVAVRFLPPIRAPDQSLKDSWSSIFA